MNFFKTGDKKKILEAARGKKYLIEGNKNKNNSTLLFWNKSEDSNATSLRYWKKKLSI